MGGQIGEIQSTRRAPVAAEKRCDLPKGRRPRSYRSDEGRAAEKNEYAEVRDRRHGCYFTKDRRGVKQVHKRDHGVGYPAEPHERVRGHQLRLSNPVHRFAKCFVSLRQPGTLTRIELVGVNARRVEKRCEDRGFLSRKRRVGFAQSF
jgi:hypothetical protein